MPKSLKEYQEMLKNMSPEQRAQFDRTNNENAMVRLNDFFKQSNLDASKYLQKAKTADGSTVCYLKNLRLEPILFTLRSISLTGWTSKYGLLYADYRRYLAVTMGSSCRRPVLMTDKLRSSWRLRRGLLG